VKAVRRNTLGTPLFLSKKSMIPPFNSTNGLQYHKAQKNPNQGASNCLF
jgi:hypothetical protein